MTDRKISGFGGLSTLPTGSYLTLISGSQNYKILLSDFLNSIGVSGSISQAGNEGIPILEQAMPTANVIRNLFATTGLKLELTPSNGLKLETNLLDGGTGVQVLANRDTSPLIRSLQAGSGISITQSGETIQISGSITPIATNTIIVNNITDLPTPASGVITLSADTTYLFSSDVDIGNNELLLSGNTSVVGSGLFNTGINTTKTGNVFTVENSSSNTVENMTITAPNATIIEAVSTTAQLGFISFSGVVIESCNRIGEFTDLGSVVFDRVVIYQITTGGFRFYGDLDLFEIKNSFVDSWTGDLIDLGSAVFTFASIDGFSVVSTNPANKLLKGLSGSGNIRTGGKGYVAGTGVYGAFTQSSTIIPSDVRWNFEGGAGLQKSRNIANMTMPTNATATVISTITTPVAVAGVFSAAEQQRFTISTSGKITYIGEPDIVAQVQLNFAAQKQVSGECRYTFYIYKNGVKIPGAASSIILDDTVELSVSIITISNLSKNDYLELYVENNENTDDVLVFSVQSIVSGL